MKRPKTGLSTWHVFTRGPRRLGLFHDDDDRLRFLSILAYALRASGAVLWAYVLMTNHYHFVIQATSDQLTACMLRLNRMYAGYYNERYRQVGHSFDAPYHRHRQKGIFFILKRIAYVFLNPVAGGLVGRPEDYRWSSLANYLGRTGLTLDVDPGPVFQMISEDPSEARSGFLRAMDREAAQPSRKTRGAPTALEAQAEEFSWLHQHAREAASDLLGQDPLLVAMHWAKECGIPPRAIALALGERSTLRLRVASHRFEAKLKAQPELADHLPVP